MPKLFTCGWSSEPLVMDNRFFVLTLVLVGLLCLVGNIFFPIIGIGAVVRKWMKSIGLRKKNTS